MKRSAEETNEAENIHRNKCRQLLGCKAIQKYRSSSSPSFYVRFLESSRFDDYVIFISDIVIQEASKGDKTQAKRRSQMLEAFQVLEIDDEVKLLAQKIIDGKVVPEKCPEDALHIAVAAANGMDVIVTWNFKHINNPFTRKRVRQIVEENRWVCPEICSPEELLGGEV